MMNELIKRLRKEKGLSQRSLAELMLVAPYTVGNWEQHRSEPDIESIRKLCIIFNVSADELLEIETESQRDKVLIANRKIS